MNIEWRNLPRMLARRSLLALSMAIALSLTCSASAQTELDPNFGGKQVIIAYERNGEPNPETIGLRLVIPGDKHGGRSVRDVVRVEVK